MLEKNLMFDKRIIDRNLKRGSLTKKAFAEHMRGLKNQDKDCEWVTLEVKAGEYAVSFPERAEEGQEGEGKEE